MYENLPRILFDYGQKRSATERGFQPCLLGSVTCGDVAAGDAGFMFFLLRMAFWLGLVLVLLPIGPHSAARRAGQRHRGHFGGLRHRRRSAAVLRASARACTVGSQVATAIGYRAQAGAKMLYDVLSERWRRATPARSPTGDERQPAKRRWKSPAQRPSQSTLTPADLAPAWRGPAPRKDGKHPHSLRMQ